MHTYLRWDVCLGVPTLSNSAKNARSELRSFCAAWGPPSSLMQWIELPAAGSTTAEAAEKQGLQKVYFPDAPGLDGFVDAIARALEQNDRSRVLSAV